MICKATLSDLSTLVQLEQACFSAPWTEQMLKSSLNNPLFTAFIVKEGDTPVGYASLTTLFEEGELDKICVLPNRRKNGYATALLTEAIGYAAGCGVTRFFLEVRMSNTPAQRLYEKFGFCRIAVRKKYYENGEDAVVYQKTLR